MKVALILIIFIIVCLKIIFFSAKKKELTKKTKCNYKKIYNNTNKKYLDNIHKRDFYNRISMDDTIKNKLNKISIFILDKINNENNMNFHKTGYDNILVKSDNKYNKNYIYDLFVYDKTNNYDLKLKVDIIYFNDISNKNKSIPSPMEIISIPNNTMMSIDIKKTEELFDIHVNSIDIINSLLFTSDLDLVNTSNTDNVKISNNDFKGLNDTSNEFSLLTSKIRTPYIQKSTIRNKWPELNKKKSLLKAEQKNWDEWGIPNGRIVIKEIQRISSNDPAINRQYGNIGQYHNLFEKSNFSGAVSSSNSQPMS